MAKKNNIIVKETNYPQYSTKEMSKGKMAFKPLVHKETKKPYSDLDYLLALGEQISLGEEEWKKSHPYREYKVDGVDPSVQDFAQIVYKGYKDGISKQELSDYIADSIDLDS